MAISDARRRGHDTKPVDLTLSCDDEKVSDRHLLFVDGPARVSERFSRELVKSSPPNCAVLSYSHRKPPNGF